MNNTVVWAQYINLTDTQTATSQEQKPRKDTKHKKNQNQTGLS